MASQLPEMLRVSVAHVEPRSGWSLSGRGRASAPAKEVGRRGIESLTPPCFS